MSDSYRLQVANTFLLVVVGLIAIANGVGGAMAPTLRFIAYGVGALVLIFAFKEILTNARGAGE